MATNTLSDDLPGSAPVYARLIQTVLKTSGPTALIALALSAFLMWMVSGSLKAIAGDIAAAQVKMTAFAEKQEKVDQNRALQSERELRVLRALCVNSAKTEAAREGCYE